VFTLSEFQPIVMFGMLSALVIASALLADFVITPLAISSLRLVNLWDLLSAQFRQQVIPHSVLFRDMRPWQIRRFILSSTLIDYRPGDTVFQPGDDGDAMYLVMRGRVEVCVPGGDGEGSGIVVSRFGPGELFGDVAVLAQESRKTRAQALEPSSLLVLGRDTLYNVARYHPIVGSRIFYNLATDVSRRWIRFVARIRRPSDTTAGSECTDVDEQHTGR
jgi:CRP-like cAMP-binding protein